ncbi:MAG: 50S ribosomal protein L25/general stress protein Ctc [Gammaproteobacteria bacterium]
MEQFTLSAESRSDAGKGASRRLRKTGKVPGVVYGAKKDAVPITLNHNEVIHQLENEAFYSRVLTLNVAGQSEQVVLKDLQRHPFKPAVLHIDFLRIDEQAKLTMRVPLHFINEEQCVGVKQAGGVISHIMTELEINCLPKDLPEFIEVDVLEMNLGDTIQMSDLQLPEGVEIHALTHGGDVTLPVVSVNLPRVIEEEEEVEAEEAAAEEGAETDAEATPEQEQDKDKDKDK